MPSSLIPPQPVGVTPGHSFWNDWIEKVRLIVNSISEGLINHNDLQNIQGGTTSERYHLNASQQSGLIGSGDTSLHFHSSDRNRANHTGTQLMSTISDLPTLSSGTYTPSLTNSVNLSASSAYSCQYIRLGSVVTVSGRVDVTPTASGTLTTLGIGLPIASNFANSNELGGVASSADDITEQSAAILADSTNDRASMTWRTTSTANHTMYFTFTYRII